MTIIPGRSVSEIIARATRMLSDAGVAEAAADASVLLSAATGWSRAILLARQSDQLTESAAELFGSYIERRRRREPVGGILGRRSFWKDEFETSPDVLEPRPDSETLIETVVKFRGDRSLAPLQILDLGTGSGALLASLLREFPNATGLAVDSSSPACEVAMRNVARLGLASRAEVRCMDWRDLEDGAWDIIVSNPPYIPSSVVSRLEPEVLNWDPLPALDGGQDGLDAYRSLAGLLPRLMNAASLAVLEIGYDQAVSVPELLRQSRLSVQDVTYDLGGNPRAVAASLASADCK